MLALSILYSLLVAMGSAPRVSGGHKSSIAIDEKVHVALSAGVSMRSGLEAVVYSMISNTASPRLLQVHIFISDLDRSAYKWVEGLARMVTTLGAHLAPHVFSPSEVDPYINKHFKRFRGGNLTEPYNYVRFILPLHLKDIAVCTWLDSDFIVQGDFVKFLLKQNLGGKAVGAVARRSSLVKDSVYEYLQSRGIDVAKSSPGFNAGFLVIDLKAWHKQNATLQILAVCKINEEKNLYPYFGSQPPLQIILGGDRFHHIHPSMQNNLGVQTSIEPNKRAMLLHYNGPNKPWGKRLCGQRQFTLWEKYRSVSNLDS